MQKKLLRILVFLLSFIWVVPIYAGGEETYPYYVTVNLTQNIVTVYNKDKEGNYTVPEKAFYCSVGEETPTGTFRTSDKYVWRPLFGNVYGQYATRITGHILFHSVPYYKQDKSTLEFEEYNKLGETASMGCIRLTVEDVKWIYDNCPAGTTVKMFRSTEPEPLEPPKPQKIDINDSRRDWDPTDPDSDNPWKKGKFVEMSMRSENVIRKVDAYYRNGNYALQADDAQLIFGHLGITLVLPEDNEGIQEEGEVEVLFQRSKHKVFYIMKNGKTYFNLRDLGELTETKVTWNDSLGQINLERMGANEKSKFSLFPWKSDANQSTTSVSLVIDKTL